MRRHDPDDLTAREREALDLIRLGLTNEEIARRLGMTFDGAKYHVSQILSKLGVATREEAAAWRPEERRAWWARWPLWAKIAGAATVAAALGGLAVLVWSAIRTEEELEESVAVSDLTLEELYGRVQQAMTRPGFVLHSSLEVRQRSEDGAITGEPLVTADFWIDASNDRWRDEFHAQRNGESAEGPENIVNVSVDGFNYVRTDSDAVEKQALEPRFCPRTDKFLVSWLLLCSGQPTDDNQIDARIESTSGHDGESAIALVIEESYVTNVGDGALPPHTLGTVPPTEPATSTETRNTSRTRIAVGTFLPIARTYEIRADGQFHDASEWTYEHEFLPLDELPLDFFDPVSIGYSGED